MVWIRHDGFTYGQSILSESRATGSDTPYFLESRIIGKFPSRRGQEMSETA
jgi:hypothetical protein